MANTPLSPREQEVLVLVWQGFTTREISRILHRSFNTIAMHRRHILKKFGARTTMDALKIAQQQQLVKPLRSRNDFAAPKEPSYPVIA